MLGHDEMKRIWDGLVDISSALNVVLSLRGGKWEEHRDCDAVALGFQSLIDWLGNMLEIQRNVLITLFLIIKGIEGPGRLKDTIYSDFKLVERFKGSGSQYQS